MSIEIDLRSAFPTADDPVVTRAFRMLDPVRHEMEAAGPSLYRCCRCPFEIDDRELKSVGGHHESNWSGKVIEFKGGISPDAGNWPEARECSGVPS